jgi:serine/threonine protein phosphatase PrpC
VSSSLVTSHHRPPVSRRPRPCAQAFGLSDVGLVRSSNEDAYAVVPALGFFAVADGVGGNAAGDVASRMAIDAVQAVLEDPATPWPAGAGAATAALDRLAGGVEYAGARVFAAAAGDRAKKGMGTTFSGLLLLEGRAAAIAHVGDSRIYLLRGRRFEQLTEDHSLVHAYVRAGALTREQAATSPIRNVITRAVGTKEAVEVDSRLLAVEPGDTFLLASDGLHGVVEDEQIAAVLLRERDITRAAAELVERANDAGGPDNVTAVLVHVG